jgi:two-component system OmpR family sensor kinase
MGLTGFRSRVVAVTVLLSALVVSVSVVLTQTLLARSTEAEARTLARTRAAAVASTAQVYGGRVRVIESAPDTFDTVAWVYADGRLLDGQVPRQLRPTADRLAASGVEEFTKVEEHLLYAIPRSLDGHRVTAVVTVDLTPYEKSERRTLIISLALGMLAVVLTGLVAHEVVRQSLRVVRRMSTLADEWGEHDPGRRFGQAGRRDEFGELAHTLDHMLERISATLADERRLTDEIAHELRTPMTVLRGEAQLAQLRDGRLDPALVLVEVDRLQAAVTAILDAARSRMRGEGSCHLRVALEQAARGRAVSVEVAEDVEVDVPADLVAALLAPLLDNAARHAQSQVAIVAELDHGKVIVRVLDDGPGFAAEDVQRVFEPGASGGSGHGLGLAVVRRVAVATGVEVRAVPDGRGHVELRLPMR